MNILRTSQLFKLIASLALCLLFASCSTQNIKTTTFTPLNDSERLLVEDELLDVGIAIFDPGLDEMDEDEADLTFADVRRAETYYISHLMAETLQLSANWGVVRVIPSDLASSDVAVRGTILQSDGETL